VRAFLTGPAFLALAACGGGEKTLPGLGPAPIPYADTLPIEEPEARAPRELAELLKASMRDEVAHTLSPRTRVSPPPEALNVTHFDDVVSSAWFEHRITGAGLSPEEVAAGPDAAGPDTSRTLTVISGKGAGVSPGFTVRDRKGDRYLLKFDPPGFPGLASGADVVSSRLFWAAGYHVPRDEVITIDPGLLEVADDATMATFITERPMVDDDVIAILEEVDPLPDGRFRALASRLVDGVPKGPFRFEGTRDDDPNDHYPHEDRRELRGLWVLAAWLEHVDLRFANTLDAWIDPPGYLRHYLIDFGATLGSRSIRVANPREGREHAFDLWPTLGRLTTFGFYRVGWEKIEAEPIRPSLGWIATESYEPGEWKPFWPNEAYRRMTERDGYWGAKLVAAFDEAHLRAAIREGRYPDRAAADSLLDILLYRQEKTVRHWFSRVSPLEEVAVEGRRGSAVVTFRDLGLSEELWSPSETRYRWRLTRGDAVLGRGEGEALPGKRQRLFLSDSVGGIFRVADRGTRGPTAGPGEDGGGSGRRGRRRGGGNDRDRSDPLLLQITALRPGVSGRPVRITLIPRGEGYEVAGLAH